MVLAAPAVGCGSGSHDGRTGENKEGQIIKEELRSYHKQLKQERAAAVKSGRGDTRRGTNTSDGSYQNSSSKHPGGASFLFCDGSTRFLKSSVAMRTYWALGTKANGEAISSDSY